MRIKKEVLKKLGERIANIFGQLKFIYPLTGDPDYAFKIFRDGTTFRESSILPADTLLCGEDTIHVSGIYEDDTLGVYSYSWDFGNGQTSEEINPTVVYQEPGSYSVILLVADTIGNIDTLSQVIVVPTCNNNARQSIGQNSTIPLTVSHFHIEPNPNNGEFKVTWEMTAGPSEVLVYNSLGEIVFQRLFSERELKISLSDQPSGIYFIKGISDGKLYFDKIIKQ